MKNKILKKINKKLIDSDNFFDGEINEILNIINNVLTKSNIDNNDLTFINKIRKFYNDRIDCIKGWCNNCKLRMKKN